MYINSSHAGFASHGQGTQAIFTISPPYLLWGHGNPFVEQFYRQGTINGLLIETE